MKRMNCFLYREIQELYPRQFVVCKILDRLEGKTNLFGVVDSFENKTSAKQLLASLDNDGDDYIMIPTFEDYELLYELDMNTFVLTPLLNEKEMADFLRRYYGWF